MANVFKNSMAVSVGTTGAVVYTTPSATSTTLIGLNVANTNSQNISVSVMVSSPTNNKTVYLVKNALIPVGGASVLVGGEQKIVLSANDNVQVTSSLASSADVIVSYLEIS
jgi:hypothetical protein